MMPEQVEPGPELYRELVEQVPVVAYVAVPDEVPRVLYMSPQSREVLGHSVHGLNDYPPMGGVRPTCDEDACDLTLCPVELAMSDEGGAA